MYETNWMKSMRFRFLEILLLFLLLLENCLSNEEHLNFLIKRFIKNAETKIRERNAWLSPKHTESADFKHMQFPGAYYMFVPVYPCLWDFEKIPGSDKSHDGGKWICGLSALNYHRSIGGSPECIVYSFGSRGDFTFENQVLSTAPMCNIFTFDPTWEPEGEQATNGIFNGTKTSQKPYVKYVNAYGLSGLDEEKTKERDFSVRRLETIMKQFNHDYIDILKIDIEGCEWSVFKEVDWSFVKAGQLLVELHPYSDHDAEYLQKVFMKIETAGFFLTGIEPVTKSNKAQAEVTFLHKDWRPSGC